MVMNALLFSYTKRQKFEFGFDNAYPVVEFIFTESTNIRETDPSFSFF